MAELGTVADVLGCVSPDRRELFEIRVARWWPDLVSGLAEVYSPGQCRELEVVLLDLAARAYVRRDPALHRLDVERTLAPDWFQQPRMLGYAAYTDRFAGTIAGLDERLDHLAELGVTYLHLMPLLRPRDGDNDGGYAVADYRSVRPDLGTMDDLRSLTATLRGRGVSLVLDLVLNHVAREHEWAEKARAGDPRFREFFHVYAGRSEPDAYERTLPEIFPDNSPGNFTWDDDLDAWVWTTFNSWQWDLNWTNPDVFAEYADIVFELANVGVEVLRLDAIAFLWKRLGTNCQNQPEVHAITQALRALIRIVCPAVVLKAEAIVGPDDLVQYLGRGKHHGRVSDLAYHNSLMVQIWSMLAAQDVRLTVQALQALPPVPTTTAWITYVRCHDDIGWAIGDADAAAVGLDGFAHRAFLSDWYTGSFPGSTARGLVFQANPLTGDRRVSGMTSALAGLSAAGDPGAITAAVDRVLLAYAVVLGWGGVPVFWMGDEFGQANDDDWAGDPAHADDNRWVHRPRWSPSLAAAARQGGTVPARLFAGMRHLAATRAGLPMLHASVPAQVLRASDPGILAVLHSHPEGELLQLYNVTDSWRGWPAERIAAHGLAASVDALTRQPIEYGGDGQLWLPPYAARWYVTA